MPTVKREQVLHRRHGRRTPYTQTGVRRVPCFRCGQPAEHQWQVCADGNLYRPLCGPCDVKLNALVLSFMQHPRMEQLMEVYAKARGFAIAMWEPLPAAGWWT
jgi:hypothetical protein